jgi:hypothetical protein
LAEEKSIFFTLTFCEQECVCHFFCRQKIIFERYLVSNPDWCCDKNQSKESRSTVPLNWRRYDYLDEDYYSDELVDEEFIPEFVTKPTEYVVSGDFILFENIDRAVYEITHSGAIKFEPNDTSIRSWTITCKYNKIKANFQFGF